MTKDELIIVIGRVAQKRVVQRLAWVPQDAAKDWDFNSPAWVQRSRDCSSPAPQNCR